MNHNSGMGGDLVHANENERKSFGWGENPNPPHPIWDGIADQQLGLDSHGSMVVLVVLKHRKTGELYGFSYQQTSEEAFFDGPDELVPLVGEEVTKMEYKAADGTSFF